MTAAFNARGHIKIEGLTSLLIRNWVFTIYMPSRFDAIFIHSKSMDYFKKSNAKSYTYKYLHKGLGSIVLPKEAISRP